MTLAEKYDKLDDKPLDVTCFRWTTIAEIAQIISDKIENITVTPGTRRDMTQKDMQNEPDPSILELWKPEISLEDGIQGLIDEYSKGN